MQQNQPQMSDVTMLIFRIESLEKDVERLNMQLSNYVPQRENDIKLQSIQDIVRRIETELIATKQELVNMNNANKQEFATMGNKLASQEIAARERDEKQREEAADMQINTLKWAVGVFVGLVVTILGGVVIYYLTHPGG